MWPGSIFKCHPDTMLGRMFGSARDQKLLIPNENGDYVIHHDLTPEAFAAILDYYKHGQILCPPTVAVSELREACDYFQVPFTSESVRCDDVGKFLHELSNKGAVQQFAMFLQRFLVPAMARCAKLGERDCHIVVLAETDTIEWDTSFPPRLGEQFAKGKSQTGQGAGQQQRARNLMAAWPDNCSGAQQFPAALSLLLRES